MKKPIDIELHFRLVVQGEELELINLLFNNMVKLIIKLLVLFLCKNKRKHER